MAGDPKFDGVIMDIGLMTAAAMENFCNRRFARGTGLQDVFPADRASFILSHYPVEQITLVELKLKDADGFVAQDRSFIESTGLSSGIVYLPDNVDAAEYWAQLRFTYDGGYFFETLEPDDKNYPSPMPAGATPLPADLRGAWLLQCRQVWDFCDKLGLAAADKPKVQSALAELDWSPMVKGTLQRYQQMQPI